MSDKPENPPAFPCVTDGDPMVERTRFNGMTLRDWFAGQALIGLLANRMHMEQTTMVCEGDMSKIQAVLAITSYAQADAMLQERKVR